MRLNVDINNNGPYFILQSILFLVSPILSLFLSLYLYRKTVSQFFFVLFAFYFGYQLGPMMDLKNHYLNYKLFFDIPFTKLWANPVILYYGNDPYHVIFKYILSRFHASARVFAGTAAAVYATVFIFYFRQFKPLYQKGLNSIQTIALFAMVVVVDFYWYLGLRFWTGAFVLMIFYCKYQITGKRLYLYLTPICLLFHYVLLSAIACIFFVELTKNNRILQYVLLAISFVYRNIDFGLLQLVSKLPFINHIIRNDLSSGYTRRALQKLTKFYYSEGNIIYASRSYVLIGGFFGILFLLWRKNANVNKTYPYMLGVILIMLTMCNFGHGDYTFYTRMLKFTALMCYTYLFMILCDKQNYWLNRHLFVKIFLFSIAIFAFAISVFQLRQVVLNPALLFGNFFTDVPIYNYVKGNH